MVAKNPLKKIKVAKNSPAMVVAYIVLILVIGYFVLNYTNIFSSTFEFVSGEIKIPEAPKKVLDVADYDRRMLVLATASSTFSFEVAETVSTTTLIGGATSTVSTSTVLTSKPIKIWGPEKTVYPNPDAILPFKRIVAYYGNFLSKQMGVLGQYPEEEMLNKLRNEVTRWEEADPTTPVMPAIDYIAVTAQGSAGDSGKYRLRMSDIEIDKALALAEKVNGIVILEVQAGFSTVESEIPALEKYLKLPQVHLALDPEFYMKTGKRPGLVIGSMDAKEINWAANYLANLVVANNLPPKILIVHRFTHDMVTNSEKITPLPEVQIVMDMDGWGSPARKINTYTKVVTPVPVQFTGFKLFYKNDILAPSPRMMTPEELLNLKPRPIFIQYQ